MMPLSFIFRCARNQSIYNSHRNPLMLSQRRLSTSKIALKKINELPTSYCHQRMSCEKSAERKNPAAVPMISLRDVDRIVIDSSCKERFPCIHASTITLKDGRIAKGVSSFDICSIVAKLAKERINPGQLWDADSVREHFHTYSNSIPEMGWKAELPEVVLNRIFSDPKYWAYSKVFGPEIDLLMISFLFASLWPTLK